MSKLRGLNARIQIMIFPFLLHVRLPGVCPRFWFERLVVGEILYGQFFYPLTFFFRKSVFCGVLCFVPVVTIVLFFVVAFWFEAFKDGHPIGFVGSYEYSAGDCLLNRRAKADVQLFLGREHPDSLCFIRHSRFEDEPSTRSLQVQWPGLNSLEQTSPLY